MYTYINCSEELALLDFIYIFGEILLPKMKGDVTVCIKANKGGFSLSPYFPR